MNERIKALAVEADFMLCEDGHFYSEGQSQKITDGLQKFAELIVQECIQEMTLWERIDLAIRGIKERFGVEE